MFIKMLTDFLRKIKIFDVFAFFFSVLVFAVLFLAIRFTLLGQESMRYRTQSAGENCYRLSNFLTTESVKERYAEGDFEAFTRFQERLMAPSEEFTYATLASLPITVSRKLDDTFLHEYNAEYPSNITPHAYSSVQLNEAMNRRANLVPEEGRGFSVEDFDFSGKNEIAVLLGNQLKEYYTTGDAFPFIFRGIEFSGQVVGVLPTASEIHGHGGVELPLDRAFVLPDLVGGARVADNRSAFNQNTVYGIGRGYFYTPLSALQMQERVERMIADAGLQSGDFCLEGLAPLILWDLPWYKPTI